MAWRLIEALELGGHTYTWEHNSTVDHILNKINSEDIWGENNVNIGVVPIPDAFAMKINDTWGPGNFRVTNSEPSGDEQITVSYVNQGFFIEFPEWNNRSVGLGFPTGPYYYSPFNLTKQLNHYVIGRTNYYEDEYISNKNISQGAVYGDDGTTDWFSMIHFQSFLNNAVRTRMVDKYGNSVQQYFEDPDAVSEIFFLADDENHYITVGNLVSHHKYQNETYSDMEQNWSATRPNSSSIPSLTNMYTWLIGHETEPTTEDWTPIPNIADNEGRATMLAMVKASELNGGLPVTTGALSQIERIFSDPYESKAYLSAALMFNEQGDVEEKFMMSGDNYMNVTIDSKTSSYEFTYTLDFYLADDTLIYSHQYTVNHDDHYLGAIRRSDGTAARPSMIIKNAATYSWNTEADFDSEEDEALYSWFIGTGGNPNPFVDDELSDEQQGGLDYFPVPTDNDIGAGTDARPNDNRANTGFFNAYVMGDQDLYELAEDLWTDSFWEDLKEYYATPADAIMALFELPFDTGYHGGSISRTAIKIGNKTSRATAIPITDSYATFEMGEIEVKPESDSYIDFKNYTKFYLYMPFVGVQEIDANLLMSKFDNDKNKNTKIVGKGSILRLQYTVDVLTGLLVAKVFINEILRYQWVGDCHSQLPYSWQTHQAATSQTISTIVSGIGAALATGAAFITGGAAIPVAAAAGLNFSKDIVKLAVAKSAGGSITSSGAIGQLAGALSYPYPYLMRVWPNVIYSKKQEHFIGYAQPHTQKVGDHPGYIKFADVHLDDIPCTDAEREEIASILRGGVIV